MPSPRTTDARGRPLPVRLLAALLLVQAALIGGFIWWASEGFPLGSEESSSTAQQAPGSSAGAAESAAVDLPPDDAPRAKTKRFDGKRAFALLRHQVEGFGPRPAGSEASRRTAEWARKKLPRGRFEPVPGGLRNVVGVVPGRKPAIVVGAHYDTEATTAGHVGANDGAAGTAAVLELARVMRGLRRSGDRELRFVLFDGEEEPPDVQGPFHEIALRGSRAYVERNGRSTKQLVLLDYIAERGTRIPQEGSSTPELWAQLRAAARRAGVQKIFPDEPGPSIIDDHFPFLQAGIPAIDLIDFDYPQRDTTEDDLAHVSQRSLDAVGEAVAELLLRLKRK